jgi:hypothetical protein
MTIRLEDITPAKLVLAYDGIVALGDAGALGAEAARMREDFQRRTGAYGPEDPWFESRARAFWDDALVSRGFADLALEHVHAHGTDELDETTRAVARLLRRAHRGFFHVEELAAHASSSRSRARLLDLWSGAELYVQPIDEAQAIALEHAEGAMDGRVAASPGGAELWLLPGAYHHTADALEPAIDVLVAAQERGMTTEAALDALLRMDLVFRSSSRVKAGFAYRPSHLVVPHAPPSSAST